MDAIPYTTLQPVRTCLDLQGEGPLGRVRIASIGDPKGGVWTIRKFGVCCFPDPEERILERFSVAAGIIALGPEYGEKQGEFPEHEELARCFRIGSLSVPVDSSEIRLVLGLQWASRDREIALAGIKSPMRGDSRYIVEPGGFDQNLPAFALAKRGAVSIHPSGEAAMRLRARTKRFGTFGTRSKAQPR